MKRHEALRPLSRDHHQGLVHARRLRQVNSDAAAPETRELTQRLVEFFQQELSRHFREEEEELMPAFSRSVGPDDPMIVRTLSEHVELRSKIEHLTGAMENLDNIEASFLQDLGRLL